MAASIQRVDDCHHDVGSMDGGPSVGEKFLSPAAELVSASMVGGNLLNGITVTNPTEMTAPQTRVHNGEGPAAGGDFAKERMAVSFGGGTAMGGRVNGLEASGRESSVECDGGRVIGGVDQDSVGCGGRVIGLHEDERHASLGPIGYEGWKGTVTTVQEGVGWDCGGNWFAVVFFDEGAKGSNVHFKMRDEASADVEEACKGVEGLARGWQGPGGDNVKFGGGRAIALGWWVEANPFDMVEKEVTFLGVE